MGPEYPSANNYQTLYISIKHADANELALTRAISKLLGTSTWRICENTHSYLDVYLGTPEKRKIIIPRSMAFRQTYPIRARSFLDPVSPRSYTNTADRKGRLVACKQYATLGDLAIPRLAFSPVKNNQKACLWLQKDLYYFRGEAWQICVDVVVLTIFSMILVSWWFTLNGQFTGTVDEDEIERLSRSTSDWWDVFGEFAPLHAMNKLRVPFVRMRSVEHGAEPNPSRPLSGLKILDAGCGGGILSEVHVKPRSPNPSTFPPDKVIWRGGHVCHAIAALYVTTI